MHRSRPNNSNNRGFTILELLVVIGIIIILAALLLPVLMSARNKARQGQCNSNLRQIAMALQLYAQDHDDLLPMGGYNQITPPPFFVPAPAPNAPYRVNWEDELLQTAYLQSSRVLICPSAEKQDYRFSYCANRWLLKWETSVSADSLRQPSETALLSEKIGYDWPCWLPSESENNPYYAPLDPRHSDQLNVLFADGHVSHVAVYDLIASPAIIWRSP